MANYLKPQSPLQHKDGDYFYPLTTVDQIITDNDTRLSAELISVDLTDAVEGDTNMGINADTLDGKTIEEIKQQIYDEMINYSVVGGTTEPANSTENMIWVNTNQEITDYVFSKNEPKNLIEGMVWIVTGNNSNICFHTLNINGREFDEVHLLSVKQYVNDTWVSKVAKIWQGDKWIDWITYLYNKGNECTDITGGWNSNITGTAGGTLTKNAGSMTISGTSTEYGIDASTEPMDLSDVSTISMHHTALNKQTNGGASLRVYQTDVGVVAQIEVTDENTVLDISGKGFSGKNYRIAVMAYLATITVDEVYMV